MIKDSIYNKKEYNPYLLTQIQPQGGIKFDERIIQKGDGFETIINLYDYPVQVDSFWLERLLTMDDVITTIDIGTANKHDILKKLEKSLVEQENRFYEDRSKVGQIQAKSTYQSLQGLTEDITNNGEIIKMVHIRYYVSAPTKEKLESKVKEIIEKLESLGYRGTVLLNEQEYEWKSLFNGYLEQEKFINKRKGKAIPAETLGAGYPFHYTSLDDPTGMFLGTTFTGGSVILDLFTKTKDRMSYNTSIVGTSGSGKSTLLKKLVLNNAIQGQTIRILDIVGEFKSLVHALGGKTISLDGSDGIINPLQILATITDDTNKVDNEKSYMTHLSKVSMMYKFLNPESSSDEQRQFESLVSNFYRFKNIDISKCTEYDIKDYPTMSQLLEYIQNELYIDIESKIPKENLTESHRKRLESIILNIESIVRDYGMLFDGYSTIKDINKEKILSFELRNLSSFDERIFNAQIFSILTLLWNNALVQGGREMKLFNDGLKAVEDCTKYMILIDEAHRIINSNNIKSVEYLTTFEREARKYFGGLVFATQSIRDVAPANINNEVFEKIKTLFELTQYKFIMQQDNNVLSLLSEIFNGQLSENELNKIPYLKQGHCILSINGFDNIMFNVEVSKEELDLFKGGA